MEVAEKTEQAVQPGEVQTEEQAGDGVDTATTEQEVNEFSIENIGAEEIEVPAEKTDEEILNVSGKAQERYNKKIGDAIREKNLAIEEAQKAKDEIREMKAAAAIPKDKPRAPLRENYEEGEAWQDDMEKYSVDIAAYNTSVSKAGVQEQAAQERVRANDDRLLVQMDELQKKYPQIDVAETIAAVSEVNGFGAAAQYIHDSQDNGKLALYFSMNPKERTRINSLSDANAINREIGKLETELNKSKKTTKAPKPLETVEGKDSTVVKNIYDIKDNNEFLKVRMKEIREGKK